jgi:hypothetical protein
MYVSKPGIAAEKDVSCFIVRFKNIFEYKSGQMYVDVTLGIIHL